MREIKNFKDCDHSTISINIATTGSICYSVSPKYCSPEQSVHDHDEAFTRIEFECDGCEYYRVFTNRYARNPKLFPKWFQPIWKRARNS